MGWSGLGKGEKREIFFFFNICCTQGLGSYMGQIIWEVYRLRKNNDFTFSKSRVLDFIACAYKTRTWLGNVHPSHSQTLLILLELQRSCSLCTTSFAKLSACPIGPIRTLNVFNDSASLI